MYPSIIKSTSKNFFLLAGPCVIENKEIPFEIAERLQSICSSLDIPLIFKASYKKANRSSTKSFTGIGIEEGLSILQQVRKIYNIPVVTDIHMPEEAALASLYDIDVLQIPAFLCRQTDLLVAAGKTGKCINIKKGQFLSADVMNFAIEKVTIQNSRTEVMLTERGTTFGYHDLIVDFRNIPIMQRQNVPVIMDVTHSLQQPNQIDGITGGMPEMIETIAKAAIAVGCDGIFLETHPNPAKALSDGANMLKLDNVHNLLEKLIKINKSINICI